LRVAEADVLAKITREQNAQKTQDDQLTSLQNIEAKIDAAITYP